MKKNPLLNPDSKHYQMFDEKETIEHLEEMMTIDELKGWAKGNVFKYRLRIGHKDAIEKEMTKIKGYEEYYKFLNTERVLRDSGRNDRTLDYEKIKHICDERIRQLTTTVTPILTKRYITIVDSDEGQKDFCVYTKLSKDDVDEAITANKQTEDHDYESLFDLLRLSDKDLEVIDLSKIMVSY